MLCPADRLLRQQLGTLRINPSSLTNERCVEILNIHCFHLLIMESAFPTNAVACVPSQANDRFHASSSNSLNLPSEVPLPSSNFASEPSTYIFSHTQSSPITHFYVPRLESFGFGFGGPFTPPSFLDGQRNPITAPASDSPNDSLSMLGFHSPDLNYLGQQPFPSSQPPTSPPATMQTYPISNHLGSVPSRFPYIRPMPAEGLSENSSIARPQRPKIPIELAARTSIREAQPTNVVGLQGRRGILPSAVGRPAAVAGGIVTGQKSASMPIKDANGKYACEHCTKVYLHAKHLKRHLLRRKYNDAGMFRISLTRL